MSAPDTRHTRNASRLACDNCGAGLGWYLSSQPRGIVYCDDCNEKEERALEAFSDEEKNHV